MTNTEQFFDGEISAASKSDGEAGAGRPLRIVDILS